MRCCLTIRSDDEETWDELTSEVNRVVKCSDKIMAKAIRRAEEGHAKFYCNILVFLFDIKRLNIFVYSEGSMGCMHVCVNGALVFIRAGFD